MPVSKSERGGGIKVRREGESGNEVSVRTSGSKEKTERPSVRGVREEMKGGTDQTSRWGGNSGIADQPSGSHCQEVGKTVLKKVGASSRRKTMCQTII